MSYLAAMPGTTIVGENLWQGVCVLRATPGHWLYDMEREEVKYVFRDHLCGGYSISSYTRSHRVVEMNANMPSSCSREAVAAEADSFAKLILDDEKLLDDIAARARQKVKYGRGMIAIPTPLAAALFDRINYLEMRLAQSRLKGMRG